MFRAASRPLSTSTVLCMEDRSASRSGFNERQVARNPPSETLYVGNIPFTAQEDDLRELFHPYGELKSVRVAYRADGTASGFAHIEFAKLTDAKAAIDSATEEPLFLLGRTLRLDYAGKGRTIEVRPNNKLYFSGFNGGEAEIRSAAREFDSSIISFFLLKDRSSGQPTGTGFIEFMSVERATEALEQLDGMVIGDGQKLNLRYAKPRQPRKTDGGQRQGYGGDWGGSRRSEEYQSDRRGSGGPPRY